MMCYEVANNNIVITVMAIIVLRKKHKRKKIRRIKFRTHKGVTQEKMNKETNAGSIKK